MSVSIYNITPWTDGMSFSKHDIFFNDDDKKYYYALANGSGVSLATAITQYLIDGMEYDANGVYKPKFLWIPSFTTKTSLNPKVKNVTLGDGYAIRTADGINNILLEIDLSFSNRSLEEYTAIMHFLHARAGVESFLYQPSQPFNVQKKFKCATWIGTQVYYQQYNIDVKFEEVTN